MGGIPGSIHRTGKQDLITCMVPLWKKNKSKIKPEDYNEFYKAKFNDWQDPQRVIHYSVEGNISYTALLFIPSKAPYNFYNADFEPGLQLYSKGVFIMPKSPPYFLCSASAMALTSRHSRYG